MAGKQHYFKSSEKVRNYRKMAMVQCRSHNLHMCNISPGDIVIAAVILDKKIVILISTRRCGHWLLGFCVSLLVVIASFLLMRLSKKVSCCSNLPCICAAFLHQLAQLLLLFFIFLSLFLFVDLKVPHPVWLLVLLQALGVCLWLAG